MRRVGDVSWRLPLVAGHIEVGTQRPPHIAGVDTVFDGLDRGPAAQLGQNVIHHHRGAANGTKLGLDQLVELCQPHATNLPIDHTERVATYLHRIVYLRDTLPRPPRPLPITRI